MTEALRLAGKSRRARLASLANGRLYRVALHRLFGGVFAMAVVGWKFAFALRLGVLGLKWGNLFRAGLG